MRRFFVSLFIVSLLAAGGTYYWRTQHPEGTVVAPMSGDARALSSREKARTKAEKAPSERQDTAMMISVVSSVISALAAILQAWFTRRAIRA